MTVENSHRMPKLGDTMRSVYKLPDDDPCTPSEHCYVVLESESQVSFAEMMVKNGFWEVSEAEHGKDGG